MESNFQEITDINDENELSEEKKSESIETPSDVETLAVKKIFKENENFKDKFEFDKKNNFFDNFINSIENFEKHLEDFMEELKNFKCEFLRRKRNSIGSYSKMNNSEFFQRNNKGFLLSSGFENNFIDYNEHKKCAKYFEEREREFDKKIFDKNNYDNNLNKLNSLLENNNEKQNDSNNGELTKNKLLKKSELIEFINKNKNFDLRMKESSNESNFDNTCEICGIEIFQTSSFTSLNKINICENCQNIEFY